MGAFSDERLAQIDVFTDSGQRMTIAKRLVLLLAVPLLALVGLGVFTRNPKASGALHRQITGVGVF